MLLPTVVFVPSWNTDQGVLRVCECVGSKLMREMKVIVTTRKGQLWPTWILGDRFEYEHSRKDPKDGELYLGRVKPGETLVEARSDSDVQIDRQIWVKGRKTNRTI